jgi:hypothetical protein
MYRAICERHRHQRAVAVRAQVPGGVAGKDGVYRNTQVDRSAPSRSSSTPTPAALGLQAGAALVQVHPGELTTVMYEFQNVQNRTMAAQAIPELRAACRLRRTSTSWSASASTSTRWQPGEKKQWPVVVRDRSQAAEGRDHHHAVVHLLRSGRQDARRAAGAAAAPCWRPPEQAFMNQPAQRTAPSKRVAAAHRARRGLVVLRHPQEERYCRKTWSKLNPLHVIVAGVLGAAVHFCAGAGRCW